MHGLPSIVIKLSQLRKKISIMKMYIPSVGDEIVLTSDWKFNLFNEQRNSTLMEIVGDTRKEGYSWRKLTAIPCSIPAGATLKIDRIYIRKGMDDFDSITFLWKGITTESKIESKMAHLYDNGVITGIPYEKKKPRRQVRFWVKLEDANAIEFEKVADVKSNEVKFEI